MPNGLFAANLTIEKATATDGARAYSFDALDYFFDEEHALAYAFRWGRLWIDSHQ
nr:transcriptional regulator [Burkholderia sp. Ac-20365]